MDTRLRIVLHNHHAGIDKRGKSRCNLRANCMHMNKSVSNCRACYISHNYSISSCFTRFAGIIYLHHLFLQNILKGLQPNIKSHAKLPKGEKSAVIPMSESSAGLITKNNSFLSQT